MNSLPLIVGLVLALALLQVLVWIPIIAWMRRRAATAQRDLEAEIAERGERVLRGPEPGSYRGGTGSWSRVKGNGRVALTDGRLAFVKLSGGRVDVPVAQIRSVREAKGFLGAVTGGQRHVIVTLHDGNEVGFYVRDPAAWCGALRALTEGPATTGAPEPTRGGVHA